MEEYVPEQVYNNLIKMLSYRGAKVKDSSSILDSESLTQKLNHYEFVAINGIRSDDDPRGSASIMIILIAPGSKYSNKSGEFKKLLKGIPITPDGLLEVMFVSDSALTIHIKKYLDRYRVNNPKIIIEDYDYSMFIIEKPKHELVPKHTLASAEETKWFHDYYLNQEKFPKIIYGVDPMAVWLGLRPGMVIRIDRPSETAGLAVMYRVCTKF